MKPKFLIVYYTRTGNTKAVAESLAQLLDADICSLEDPHVRKGVRGYVMGAIDAIRKKCSSVEYDINPKQYSCVILATPVWAGTIPSAVRSFCEREKDSLTRYAVLTTQSAPHPQRAIKDMEKIVGKSQASCSLQASLIKKKGYQAHLKDFSYQCKQLLKKNTNRRK